VTDIIESSPALDPGPFLGPLLEVEDLHVEFRTRDGVAKAVDGVSYTLEKGQTLAVLGESGCGKSVTAQAVMGIIDSPPGFITGGAVRFNGRDLLSMPSDERQRIRGEHISMVFQDALSALNPVYTVGFQIAEMFRVHRGLSRQDAKAKAIELMERVGIPAAKQRVNDYPHQFSGGMRQRIMIAIAIALDPDVLIADEPTTALDVTVQAQIMQLLRNLQDEMQMGLILITHDLGVVADVADKIAVMYAGKIVERAPVFDIYGAPAHPYTEGLLESIPRVDRKGQELAAIKGLPPILTRVPEGCSFNPRCPYAQEKCRVEEPPLLQIAPERWSACHFWEDVLESEGTAFSKGRESELTGTEAAIAGVGAEGVAAVRDDSAPTAQAPTAQTPTAQTRKATAAKAPAKTTRTAKATAASAPPAKQAKAVVNGSATAPKPLKAPVNGSAKATPKAPAKAKAAAKASPAKAAPAAKTAAVPAAETEKAPRTTKASVRAKAPTKSATAKVTRANS
jgi:oligopeptide transport system ATP-binding protein